MRIFFDQPSGPFFRAQPHTVNLHIFHKQRSINLSIYLEKIFSKFSKLFRTKGTKISGTNFRNVQELWKFWSVNWWKCCLCRTGSWGAAQMISLDFFFLAQLNWKRHSTKAFHNFKLHHFLPNSWNSYIFWQYRVEIYKGSIDICLNFFFPASVSQFLKAAMNRPYEWRLLLVHFASRLLNFNISFFLLYLHSWLMSLLWRSWFDAKLPLT